MCLFLSCEVLNYECLFPSRLSGFQWSICGRDISFIITCSGDEVKTPPKLKSGLKKTRQLSQGRAIFLEKKYSSAAEDSICILSHVP